MRRAVEVLSRGGKVISEPQFGQHGVGAMVSSAVEIVAVVAIVSVVMAVVYVVGRGRGQRMSSKNFSVFLVDCHRL